MTSKGPLQLKRFYDSSKLDFQWLSNLIPYSRSDLVMAGYAVPKYGDFMASLECFSV